MALLDWLWDRLRKAPRRTPEETPEKAPEDVPVVREVEPLERACEAPAGEVAAAPGLEEEAPAAAPAAPAAGPAGPPPASGEAELLEAAVAHIERGEHAAAAELLRKAASPGAARSAGELGSANPFMKDVLLGVLRGRLEAIRGAGAGAPRGRR